MYTVYALYNEKHDKIYIGQTMDLDTRLKQHNDKHYSGAYTSKFDGVWIIIYEEKFNDRASAIHREKQLKSFRGREHIKNLAQEKDNNT
jgi:putative endonuclease